MNQDNNFNTQGYNNNSHDNFNMQNNGMANNQSLNNQNMGVNQQSQTTNTFDSINANNSSFNGKPPKKMNLGLIKRRLNLWHIRIKEQLPLALCIYRLLYRLV